MVEFTEKPSNPDLSPLISGGSTDSLKIDPRLLLKALRKMQGLVNGNGLVEDKISLLNNHDDTFIQMYRFKARTTLKLIPQYGIKIEPGKNTTTELIPSETEFRKAIDQISIDAKTNPEKRNQIIEYILSRPDKGFGIKEQRTRFHFLNRDFVQHEKCTPCSNSGRLVCIKCHGKTSIICTKCGGRRQMQCPRCRGSTRIQTHKGLIPCQFCRGDGKVNCSLCGARGQIKCRNCAASGATNCKTCAGTGWLSHLAHVEIYAKISFDFDKAQLPQTLVTSILSNAARCVDKHEIEVSLIKKHNINSMIQNSEITNEEPDDTVWIDYDAICPFGTISFKMDAEKIRGQLFGFQARLITFPFFLDKLTQTGQVALIKAGEDKKSIHKHLKVIAQYRLLRDIITQTLFIKNITKTKSFLRQKYITGIDPQNINKLVDSADLTLRHITRKSRILGMIIGLILYGLIIEYYFLGGGRITLKSMGIPEIYILPIDLLLVPCGVMMSVLSSKYTAKWSQNKALKNIVPDEFLINTLPKAGKMMYWGISLSVLIYTIILTISVLGNFPIPEWLRFFLSKIAAITL